jgi:hypothetical protein
MTRPGALGVAKHPWDATIMKRKNSPTPQLFERREVALLAAPSNFVTGSKMPHSFITLKIFWLCEL